MNDAPVLVRTEGHVQVVTINRPKVRNAINLEVAKALAEAMADFDARAELHVCVLTGSGGNFCSGMDLKAFAHDGVQPRIEGRGFAGLCEVPPRKPLIAAVEGYAVAGGFEIVLTCDLVVASRSASFGLPEVSRGLVASAGGLMRLAHRLPIGLALEMALTGAPITAVQAHGWGLAGRSARCGAGSGRGHRRQRAAGCRSEQRDRDGLAHLDRRRDVCEAGTAVAIHPQIVRCTRRRCSLRGKAQRRLARALGAQAHADFKLQSS